MELSNINSPAELLAANNQAPMERAELSPAELMYNTVLEELDYTEAVKLTELIINQLAIYHQNTRNELTEAGECERAALWSFDEAQLAIALNIIKNITTD